jgi:hypothetical protein
MGNNYAANGGDGAYGHIFYEAATKNAIKTPTTFVTH